MSPPASRSWLVLISGLSLTSCAVSAESRVIRDCEACTITPEHVVDLGSAEGSGVIGSPADVVRRANGQWVVTDFMGNGRLLVFQTDGSFLRALGRKGQGPGEYDLPLAAVVEPGDSLAVIDYGLGRLSILSPGLEFVRSAPLGPARGPVTLLSGGRHVISANIRTPGSIGLPLHLIGADGRVVRSFGVAAPIENLRNQDLFYRPLAADSSGTVWSGELLRYVLTQWDTTGTLLSRLERRAEWFPPQSDYGLRKDRTVPPPPGVRGIALDKRGLLWVSIDVPDPHWKDAFVEGSDPYGRARLVVEDLNAYYDGLVEIIGPVRGVVVARTRFDQRVRGFPGDGLVFVQRTVPPGYPVASIWRVRPPSPSR